MTRSASSLETLRRLRWMAAVLPITFLLVVEVARWLLPSPAGRSGPTQLTLAIVEIVAVIGFSTAMFDLLERTYRRSSQQNRELAAANAVSGALNEPGDDVLTKALDAILAGTGALLATIVVHGRESRWAQAGFASGRVNQGLQPGTDEAREVIDVPLSTGTATIGTLRLTFLVGPGRAPVMTRSTLSNMAQQLAATMERVSLIEDLQRGMKEGHAFYDVLIRISNTNPLAETLAAVVEHARLRTGVDAVLLRLNEPTTRLLQSDGELGGPGATRTEAACFCSEPDHAWDSHGPALDCTLKDDPRFRGRTTVPLRGPEGLLGDIWLGTTAEGELDHGQLRFMATLTELISIAVTSARLQGKERLAATVAERERIAREMHDSTAQVLAVAQLRLRAVSGSLGPTIDERVGAEIDAVADLCQDAYADVREAIVALREATREEGDLIDSLRSYVAKYARQSGIPTTFTSEVFGELVLSGHAELQLLRVVQEALTNVRKHSGAKSARVAVRPSGGGIEFVVRDDGRGFAVAATAAGIGLHSMRERIELVGGALRVESSEGEGTEVIAWVPAGVRTDQGSKEVSGARV